MKDTPPRAAFFRDFLFFRLEVETEVAKTRRTLRQYHYNDAVQAERFAGKKREKNVGSAREGKNL